MTPPRARSRPSWRRGSSTRAKTRQAVVDTACRRSSAVSRGRVGRSCSHRSAPRRRLVRVRGACGRQRRATSAPAKAITARRSARAWKPWTNCRRGARRPGGAASRVAHDRAHDRDPERAADLAHAVQDAPSRRRPCRPAPRSSRPQSSASSTIAIPTPPSRSAGRMCQKLESTSSAREDQERAGDQRHARGDQPARAEAVGQLARDRREDDDQERHRQEASRPPGSASSRGRSACRARRRRRRRTSRARRAASRAFAPANVRLRKSERSSIGSRWCSSSSTNAASATAAIAKQAEDPRRGPAVLVGLDQPVGEREQPDARR